MRTLLVIMTLAVLFMQTHGSAHALHITPNQDSIVLANSLAGKGIEILGSAYFGGFGSSGLFTAGQNPLGMNKGVIMSTGLAAEAVGPNDVPNKTYDFFYPGSARLNDLSGQPTYDAAWFRIQFKAVYSSVSFKYVFASEEYNERVGLNNDVFSAMVENIQMATLPGGVPVTVNTVNASVNSGLFIYNDPNVLPRKDLQYDGFTTVLTARASSLQPGQEYLLTIEIGDAGDGVYDSAVFLQEGSFVSTPEPGTMLLMGVGGAAAAFLRGRRRSLPA